MGCGSVNTHKDLELYPNRGERIGESITIPYVYLLVLVVALYLSCLSPTLDCEFLFTP